MFFFNFPFKENSLLINVKDTHFSQNIILIFTSVMFSIKNISTYVYVKLVKKLITIKIKNVGS